MARKPRQVQREVFGEYSFNPSSLRAYYAYAKESLLVSFYQREGLIPDNQPVFTETKCNWDRQLMADGRLWGWVSESRRSRLPSEGFRVASSGN